MLMRALLATPPWFMTARAGRRQFLQGQTLTLLGELRGGRQWPDTEARIYQPTTLPRFTLPATNPNGAHPRMCRAPAARSHSNQASASTIASEKTDGLIRRLFHHKRHTSMDRGSCP